MLKNFVFLCVIMASKAAPTPQFSFDNFRIPDFQAYGGLGQGQSGGPEIAAGLEQGKSKIHGNLDFGDIFQQITARTTTPKPKEPSIEDFFKNIGFIGQPYSDGQGGLIFLLGKKPEEKKPPEETKPDATFVDWLNKGDDSFKGYGVGGTIQAKDNSLKFGLKSSLPSLDRVVSDVGNLDKLFSF